MCLAHAQKHRHTTMIHLFDCEITASYRLLQKMLQQQWNHIQNAGFVRKTDSRAAVEVRETDQQIGCFHMKHNY